MHRLRTARMLARLVLAWFVLSMGVAIASPILHPKAMELVCSGSGVMKVVVKGEGDGSVSQSSGHTLDCPMCAATGAPPPAQVIVPIVFPLSHAVERTVAAHIAALTAAPLPARGPPTIS